MAYFQHADYDSGSNFNFEVNPDFGIKTGKEYSTIKNESFGGNEFTVRPHTGKKNWEWNWSNISSTFKTNLENFRNTVSGDFKSFTYNDGSTSYIVRMSKDSLAFSEDTYSRYSTNIKIREVSPS
jgi:hypothetical protein